jgi:hypothetical protein
MFGKSSSSASDRVAAGRTIKEWVRGILGEVDAEEIYVSELRCLEASCAPIETVLLVRRPPSSPLRARIPKPMTVVTQDDVVSALQQAEPGRPVDDVEVSVPPTAR